MNEMQAHGLLIPVGSKSFEVWIDKNIKEGELYSLICGDFVAFGVDEEGEIASLPQETIDKPKETFADPSTGYKEYIHIKYGIEPDRYQLQNEHAAGDKHEKSTMSLAEAATEARENSMALNHSKGNHDDSGSDIGNSRPIDHEYPISH